ncbi:VOC family protein [Serratia aquatilis]|uniref:VOC family protein n=1 Tax=Serratia aquatilis TaxID=1737515 RepID=A0ABV6E9T4_9GAMM
MKLNNAVLRIARPTDHLSEIAEMYCKGLGFEKLASFENHQGFDGVMLGHRQHAYHLEFTHHRGVMVGRAPTQDNLLVFYLPEIERWREMCLQMIGSGFLRVESYNPYWDFNGQTFEDLDGYRVVLQAGDWKI